MFGGTDIGGFFLLSLFETSAVCVEQLSLSLRHLLTPFMCSLFDLHQLSAFINISMNPVNTYPAPSRARHCVKQGMGIWGKAIPDTGIREYRTPEWDNTCYVGRTARRPAWLDRGG